MNQTLQRIAKEYFVTRSEKNFIKYYENYKGIATAAAASILRDTSQAEEVVNDLFTKLYHRHDENFQFDDKKSHVGYIWHSSSNLAKIKWNKNRVKVNNLNNCESRADLQELEYMVDILNNEIENIKVGMGFSRADYVDFKPLLNFNIDRLEEYKDVDEEKSVSDEVLDVIDEFLNDYGCATTSTQRIKKLLKLKRSDKITYFHLVIYTENAIDKIDRIIEIAAADSVEKIKKIKSKPTRKKIDKILFENTKVNMLVCESDFRDENETGDTLEYLGYVNGGNYEIDSELGDESDVMFGSNHMPYSVKNQLDYIRGFIENNDDKDNPGLLKRVLVDNLEFKSILDNIIHVIKIGEKDINGYTKDDAHFCRDLVSSLESIPSITNQAKAIDIDSCTTQEEIRDCLDTLRNIITYHTQLKCSQEEFGFNSVGAVKSKAHRYRKFLKEDFDRKMVISEITENKLHRYTGKAIDKYVPSNALKMECSFQCGILHGDFREYYESGGKKVVKIYKDGKVDGDYREFHENGKIKTTGQYSKGIKIGSWAVFREDGSKDELIAIAMDGSRMYELYDTKGNVQDMGVIKA